VAMYPPPPQTAAPATGKASGPRAGFWTRFAALFIDGIIVAIVPLIIGLATQSVGAAYAIGALFGIAYEIYFIGGPTGQTPGKRVLGIRVIDFNTGGSIGYGRAAIRWIGRIVSGIPCYLGYLWMLWDKENQCWHDKFANDVVVPAQYYPVS
jgi:uncharacterized RDD family membrane protein YckC